MTVFLQAKGHAPARETRNSLAIEGKAMGRELQIGEVVASELSYVPTEQFMLGKVVGELFTQLT